MAAFTTGVLPVSTTIGSTTAFTAGVSETTGSTEFRAGASISTSVSTKDDAGAPITTSVSAAFPAGSPEFTGSIEPATGPTGVKVSTLSAGNTTGETTSGEDRPKGN